MVVTTVERFNLETRVLGNVEVEVCCEEMGHALQKYTDGEGWGALISNFSFDQGFFFVGETSLARYCPWCGRDTMGTND